MKELRITPIAITDPPSFYSLELHAPYALRTVIEIITNDNISGISEIPGNLEIDDLLQKSKKVVLQSDPFQLNQVREALFSRFGADESLAVLCP